MTHRSENPSSAPEMVLTGNVRAAELDIASGFGPLIQAWGVLLRSAATGDLESMRVAARDMWFAADDLGDRVMWVEEGFDDRCAALLDQVPWDPLVSGVEERLAQRRQVEAAEAAELGVRLTAALRNVVPAPLWEMATRAEGEGA